MAIAIAMIKNPTGLNVKLIIASLRLLVFKPIIPQTNHKEKTRNPIII